MRLRAAHSVAALAFGVAVAAACDQPVPPPVAVREPSIEAEDIAVIRALFDEFRGELREGRNAQTATPPRFLVVDTTTPVCPRDPAILGPQPGRCLGPDSGTFVSEVVPAPLVRTVALNFTAWTAKPLSISGPLGDDVTLVSATLLDAVPPGELLRRYPPGSTIVWLSAVGYPSSGVAVIHFLGTSTFGAARFERQPQGGWRVARRLTRSVD